MRGQPDDLSLGFAGARVLARCVGLDAFHQLGVRPLRERSDRRSMDADDLGPTRRDIYELLDMPLLEWSECVRCPFSECPERPWIVEIEQLLVLGPVQHQDLVSARKLDAVVEERID